VVYPTHRVRSPQTGLGLQSLGCPPTLPWPPSAGS